MGSPAKRAVNRVCVSYDIISTHSLSHDKYHNIYAGNTYCHIDIVNAKNILKLTTECDVAV